MINSLHFRGKYGPIKKCVELKTGQTYAAKHLRHLRSRQLQQALQEVDILNGLRHQHVVYMKDSFHLEHKVVVIMEL